MLADEEDETEPDEESESLLDKIKASFPLLMAWLYKRRDFSYKDMESEEVSKFVQEITDYFNHAVDTSIRQVPMKEVSVRRLRESNYVFSGIKVFHELNEAFPSMLDENNELRPFEDFLNDVQKINNTYNGSYLRTEYNFARQSSLSAARWKQFEKDGDRYNLQYRTAEDERVRASHRKLDGITLPITSKFWDYYFPPNGWNCRCTVVQVRKGKYPESDERKALDDGSQATAGKHQEMFKFNPGKAMTTFPAYNAYTISKCKNCKYNGTMKLAADIPDNELCGTCKVLRAQLDENYGASERINKYDLNEWEHTYLSPEGNGLVVTQLERITESKASKSEKQKFEKELKMCIVLANNGHDVQYLKGENRPSGQTYDIRMDGIKADLKCVTGGAGNIVKYIKKALTKQGGEAVILEIPSHAPEYYGALAEARRKCNGRIYFYFSDDLDLKEIKK